MIKPKYTVMVDDNFHFMDESERYKDGEFKIYLEAVSRCKRIIDDYLESEYEPGMTSRELYGSYTMFGEDPFIVGETSDHFSAWGYAEVRAKEIAK